MAKKKKINIMVASTVYQNRDLLLQICGILNTYGYDVINSEYGTLHPPLGMNNTKACIAAVDECDIFFGITGSSFFDKSLVSIFICFMILIIRINRINLTVLVPRRAALEALVI